MILHSGIITLDYNTADDILATSMPDIRHLGLSEVSYCLNLIIDSVKSYDVKHLLLDSSKSVLEVEDGLYKTITQKFAMDLMGTRLRKIARVSTADATREEKSEKVSRELREELNLPIEFRNFATPAEALQWLKG